jgi:hypothetical protein
MPPACSKESPRRIPMLLQLASRAGGRLDTTHAQIATLPPKWSVPPVCNREFPRRESLCCDNMAAQDTLRRQHHHPSRDQPTQHANRRFRYVGAIRRMRVGFHDVLPDTEARPTRTRKSQIQVTRTFHLICAQPAARIAQTATPPPEI